jgi:hypothetical protein
MSSSNPIGGDEPPKKKSKTNDGDIFIPESSGWSKNEYKKDLDKISRPRIPIARPIPTKILKISDYDLSQRNPLVSSSTFPFNGSKWECDQTTEGTSILMSFDRKW